MVILQKKFHRLEKIFKKSHFRSARGQCQRPVSVLPALDAIVAVQLHLM